MKKIKNTNYKGLVRFIKSVTGKNKVEIIEELEILIQDWLLIAGTQEIDFTFQGEEYTIERYATFDTVKGCDVWQEVYSCWKEN